MVEPNKRPRRQPDALWWGLVLALAAGLMWWRATGHPLDRQRLAVAAPFVLISFGLLAAVLGGISRRR